jgi:hypothetical protein
MGTLMKDVMLDVETLGTKSTAAIIQIGACYFDRETGEIGDKFKCNIIPDLKLFTADWDTIKWWLLQSDEARLSVTGDAVRVDTAVRDLYDFLDRDDICMWSHATFDAPIVENMFNSMGLKSPVRYSRMRDIRTLMDIAEHRSEKERSGVHHDALDDCLFQVSYCVEALKKLK